MAQELISLGLLFFCALIGGLIASRFKQPAVFGLLLVGAIIGPNSLNLVQDASMINMMAEFGAILILFLVGLEFDITKLIKLGARSIVIGLLKFAIVLFFGYQTTMLMGFGMKTALFIGVILSFSSTVVVVKVLEQKSMFSRKEVPLLVTILIIEDILAVLALTFFSGLKNQQASLFDTFEHIIFAIGILVLAFYLTMKLLKYFINFIGKDSSEESVIIFLALGLGALFSYFASFLGLTPSAGAFLAGSIITSLPNAKDYARAVNPYVMIFTSIFFISMGTMVNFTVVKDNITLIGALLVIVVISRLIAIGVMTMLFANYKDEQPFFASIVMMAVGEFSLLVAKEAAGYGIQVDLVTVTAALIFLSAIIMTIGVNYTSSMDKVKKVFTIRTRLKTERISNYMRRFFDQMEIENYFTNKLKKESKVAMLLMSLTIFAFFLLRKSTNYISRSQHPFIMYAFYLISILILTFMIKMIYNRIKEGHNTMAIILTHVDNSRNLAKCRKLINNLLLSLILLFTATLFPFVIFILNGGFWINVIPFVLIALSFYFVGNTVRLIDGNHASYEPAYRPSVAFAKF